MKIRAAAVQFAPEFGEVEANLERLAEFVRGVSDADLIVAPELITTGYDLDRLATSGRSLAEPADGLTVEYLTALAKELDATLVAGFLEAGPKGSIYDSAVITSPSETAIYRKTHLYPAELAHFTQGNRLITTPLPQGPSVGTMICFDHAFPDIAATLALEGAEILAIPSAVPRGYEHLLNLRTRARAQDNQVFVVGSNLVGGDFPGESLIVGPRGEILALAGEEEGIISASLDLNSIAVEREKEPALRLRRPELYR